LIINTNVKNYNNIKGWIYLGGTKKRSDLDEFSARLTIDGFDDTFLFKY